MEQALEREAPGAAYSFLQPIEMRMQELMEAGVRSDVAVKIYGDDLDVLREKARQIAGIVEKVPGATGVRAERAAEEAHARVAAMLESITDAFFSLDREWRFTIVNQEAVRLLGCTREQLIGHGIWEMFPPAVGSRFQQEYERALAENKTVHFEEFYPPLGKWFEVHAYPSAAGLSVFFNDITERKSGRSPGRSA